VFIRVYLWFHLLLFLYGDSLMKVLVVGSGGRSTPSHGSWRVGEGGAGVRRAGNGGTALEAKCRNVPCGDPTEASVQRELAAFAVREGVGLTVIGPEAPLAAEIADVFRAAGLAVVGPDGAGARLEASKAFSKTFMQKYGVRAAERNHDRIRGGSATRSGISRS
jgi:phosphoribosylamine--glycine ligase